MGCSPSVAVEHGDVRDPGAERVGDGGDSEVGDGGAAGAEQHRGDVDDDLVDQAGPQEGRGQGGAALEEDVLAVAGVELGQRGVRVAGAEVDGLGVAR